MQKPQRGNGYPYHQGSACSRGQGQKFGSHRIDSATKRHPVLQDQFNPVENLAHSLSKVVQSAMHRNGAQGQQ